MKLLKTILCLLVACPLWGQYDDILKDKNVVWAAEFEIDFIVDNQDDSEKKDLNTIKTIKLLDLENEDFEDKSHFLVKKILDLVFQNKIEIFSENSLKLRVDSSVLIRKDTLTCCDCLDFNHSYSRILTSKTSADDIYRVRAKQSISYNSKRNNFNIQTTAVALMTDSLDDAGNYLGLKPLFWFKPNNDKVGGIDSKDIVWGKRFSTKKNSILFDSLKIIKNTLSENIIPHFLNSVHNKKLPIYAKESNNYMRLADSVIQDLFERKDTVYNYNVPQGKNRDTIINYYFKLEAIRKLRMVQEWFWDDKKKQLIINLISVAPLIPVKDDAGNFLFDKPLFYRKTKED